MTFSRLLASASFILLFTFSSFTSTMASTNPKFNKEGDPTTIHSQVSQLLSGIDAKMLGGKHELLVDFMLNGKSEILVLSTNNKLVDGIIKTRLNYKKLTKHNLVVNKKYTLPVVFNID